MSRGSIPRIAAASSRDFAGACRVTVCVTPAAVMAATALVDPSAPMTDSLG